MKRDQRKGGAHPNGQLVRYKHYIDLGRFATGSTREYSADRHIAMHH
jgi:hypothetical protein